jgi:hypothetical protein
VRDAAAFQHRKALGPAMVQELGAQPRLAGAGFRHDPQDLSAIPRPAPEPPPAASCRGRARQRQRGRGRASGRDAYETFRLPPDRTRRPARPRPYLEAAAIAELEIAFDQPGDLFGQTDVAGVQRALPCVAPDQRRRIVGSAAGRSLRQNRALGWPINRFLRDIAVGVIRQWDRRGDADHTAQQDIQRD